MDLSKRDKTMAIWSVIALFLYTIADPDLGLITNMAFGGDTLALVILSLKAVIYLVILHWARKAMFDYDEANFRNVISLAVRTPEGAGRVAIALSVMTLALAIIISAVVLAASSTHA